MKDDNTDIVAGIILILVTIIILAFAYCDGVDSKVWIKGMGWVTI
jgi:hypothetical protein